MKESISVAGTTATASIRQQEAGLPALTLAVLHERQLHQLVLHEGGSHQLRTQQHKSALSTILLWRRLGWSVRPSRYLHGERVRERGNALQGFVGAAAAASSQRHAGRDEEMVRLPR